MLSAAFLLPASAADGPAGLPVATAAAPGIGMAGLAVAAVFAALVGMRAPAAASDAGEPTDEEAGWTTGLRRPVAALCAGAFGLKGALCGGLAWQSWELQGPGGAVGLAAVALVFLSAALAFAGRALRRG